MSKFVPLFEESTATAADPSERFAALGAQPDAVTSTTANGAPPGQLDPAQEACAEPRVTLIRDQDGVSRIVIECACGRKVELDCVY